MSYTSLQGSLNYCSVHKPKLYVSLVATFKLISLKVSLVATFKLISLKVSAAINIRKHNGNFSFNVRRPKAKR